MVGQVPTLSQRIVDVHDYVWDMVGGVWVPETQPGGGGGGGGAVTIADGADVAEGAKADAAWSGVGAGTVVAILKKLATSGTGGGPATIADGADTVEGALADAAVVTDIAGTVSGKLRGLVKIFADVWDSVAHTLKVALLPCATAHLVVAGSTNQTSIKGTPGTVYGVRVFNNAGYPIFVKFHDTAGAPVAGVGVVRTVGVQAGTQRDLALANGIAFANGIGLTVVKGILDADVTAVVASDGVVDVDYR